MNLSLRKIENLPKITSCQEEMDDKVQTIQSDKLSQYQPDKFSPYKKKINISCWKSRSSSVRNKNSQNHVFFD